MSPMNYELENYSVRHYKTSKNRLALIFCSAGQQGAGEPVEEFRGTLSKFDLSSLFVIDKNNSWLNHGDKDVLFEILTSICNGYDYVFVTGESMGGASAIAFAAQYKRAIRVLSFTPQYSICPPFILFDSRYREVGLSIAEFKVTTFLDWGLPCNCEILFGNTEWRDGVHAACYISKGASVSFVNGGGHSVAFFLKVIPGNILNKIFARFTDINLDFNKNSIRNLLGNFHTNEPEHLGCSLMERNKWEASEKSKDKSNLCNMQQAENVINLRSKKLRTSQSSLSPWSKGSIFEESQRPIYSSPGNGFAFHTLHEHMPWWEADFDEIYEISGLVIYNRSDNFDVASRASHLRIVCRNQNGEEFVAHNKLDGDVFGSTGSGPYIWQPPKPVLSSLVRIQLMSINAMHFERVEIYGRKYVFSDSNNTNS